MGEKNQTADHKQKMQEFLSSFGIAMPVDEFVSLTSNIYHSYEAKNYDERHQSIEYSKKYWRNVTAFLAESFISATNLSVLDFGCGTGFATEQLLQSKMNAKIGRISCYDLSAHMVEMCRQKFGSDSRLSFFADAQGRDEMLSNGETYDIIVCNSLMHHILEPSSVFSLINKFLKPGGIFVMGHEPNKLFYDNKVLQGVTNIFRLHKKIRRRLINQKINKSKDIAVLTHSELVSSGLVPAAFPIQIIPKFVDIHVPMSNYSVQPWGELGFDVNYVNRFLDNNFTLVSQITYSHIKDQEANTSFLWRNVAAVLSKIFPHSGADSIFVFKKSEKS